MSDIVLKSLHARISEIENSQLAEWAYTYIRRTACYFLENNVNLVTALLGGGQCTDDVEPEINLLIEISTSDPESRSRLIQELDETLKMSIRQMKERGTGLFECSELPSLTWEEGASWDSVRKLRKHLLSMRMDLEDESTLRRFLPSVCGEGIHQMLDKLLDHLERHPSIMNFRTADAIVHLASCIAERMENGSAGMPAPYSNSEPDQIRKLIPASIRKRLWFEMFIPQHDGWALSLGDTLESASPEEQEDWTKLFETARHGGTPKPSKAFVEACSALRRSVDDLKFMSMFNEIEAAMRGVCPVPVWRTHARFPVSEESTYSSSTELMLRGLVRIASYYKSPRTFLCLERIMERSFEKIVCVGPRCEALGQEALDAMVTMEIEEKVSRLQVALKTFKANKNVAKRISKSIAKAGGSA